MNWGIPIMIVWLVVWTLVCLAIALWPSDPEDHSNDL